MRRVHIRTLFVFRFVGRDNQVRNGANEYLNRVFDVLDEYWQ